VKTTLYFLTGSEHALIPPPFDEGIERAIPELRPNPHHDVIEWFKAQAPGYPTRINSVLRAFRDASAA
jgi:hypothetical protein